MSNRYQDDLKRIVGITDESGKLNKHTEKKPIKGGRGIVYFDAKGNSQVASGNAPSETTDKDGKTEKDEGTTQPGANNSSGGTSGGGSNGGNKLTDTPLKPPTTDSSSASDAGSGIAFVPDMKTGDVPTGTELVDCDSGQCIVVRYDGQFSSPDGWDNPDSSPVPDGYLEGYYWSDSSNNEVSRVSSAHAFFMYVGQGLADNLIAIGREIIEIWYDVPIYYYTASPYNARTHVHVSYRAPTDPPGYVATSKISNVIAYKRSCTLFPTADYCTIAPFETDWPVDKCTELSYNAETGKFETHPGDTNVPAKLSNGVSVVPPLCDSRGHHITHYTQANGGLAVYDAETGIARFIDADGKVTGYGDGAAITANQPR